MLKNLLIAFIFAVVIGCTIYNFKVNKKTYKITNTIDDTREIIYSKIDTNIIQPVKTYVLPKIQNITNINIANNVPNIIPNISSNEQQLHNIVDDSLPWDDPVECQENTNTNTNTNTNIDITNRKMMLSGNIYNVNTEPKIILY